MPCTFTASFIPSFSLSVRISADSSTRRTENSKLIRYLVYNEPFGPFFAYSVGRRKKPPVLGLRPRYYSARSDTSDRRLEALNLPPTKVEEKRTKLQRLYERKEKKRAENLLRQAKEKEDAMGHPEPSPKISDYEKNKLKISKSHIELPTCSTSYTDRSVPSATQRGTQ